MIVFTEHSIKGKILNSHNNSVVRFHSDSNKNNVYCEVAITARGKSYVFKIHPSPQNSYYFNFKEAVTSLLEDNIKDDCNYSQLGDSYRDESADITISVDYKIIFNDLTEDIANEKYYFVYSAFQEWERKQYEERGDNFPLHYINRKKQTYLTCFRGYPFDISIYGEVEYTGGSYENEEYFLAAYLPYPQSTSIIGGGDAKGVSRLVLSNGVNISNSVGNKYNNITVNGHSLNIETKDNCSGNYLKWRNVYGGWDYYLFERNHTHSVKNKVGKEVTQNSENFERERTRIASISAEEHITLYANRVNSEFFGTIKGLLSSPKVYLYLGDKNTIPQQHDWQSVYVKNEKIQYNSRKTKFTLKIDIYFPENEML